MAALPEGTEVMPLLIPSVPETLNAGMADTVQTFKAMVPFPGLRSFLQFWQEEIDGPLHEVHIASSGFTKASIGARHVLDYHN